MEEFNPKDKSKVRLEYFTPARVALHTECNRHPILVGLLKALGTKADWADKIGEIAAYCNVAMEGLYSNEDLEILYPQLTKRMVDTRLSYSSGIVLHS